MLCLMFNANFMILFATVYGFKYSGLLSIAMKPFYKVSILTFNKIGNEHINVILRGVRVTTVAV